MISAAFSPRNFSWSALPDAHVRSAAASAELDPFTPVYERANRVVGALVVMHVLLSVALAPVYGTWAVVAWVGLTAAVTFFASWRLAPAHFVTRNLAGLSLQVFCALHIYQMRGMAEMHFFFFTAVTAMILYQDWRAMWLGVLAIIAQHSLFSVWHNGGVHPGGQAFFEQAHVSGGKIGFHFGIALLQVAFAAACAHLWRSATKRELALAADNDALRRAAVQPAAPILDHVGVAREHGGATSVLARVSHELRTPLNAIGGYTEILELGIHGALSDKQADDVQRIRANNAYLLAVTSTILEYARLERNETTVHGRPVMIAELLESVKPLVAPQVAERGLTLLVGECSADLHAIADPDKARQILVNLLTNAVKFTPAGGAITMGCRGGRSTVAIWVRDTGRGIPLSQLESIFRPFVQIDRDETPQSQRGVGLGLAISRSLAVQMHGDLRVESTPGNGATFTLELPAR